MTEAGTISKRVGKGSSPNLRAISQICSRARSSSPISRSSMHTLSRRGARNRKTRMGAAGAGVAAAPLVGSGLGAQLFDGRANLRGVLSFGREAQVGFEFVGGAAVLAPLPVD